MTRTRIALLNLMRTLPDWPEAWIAKQTDNKDVIGFLLTILAKGVGPHLLPIGLFGGQRLSLRCWQDKHFTLRSLGREGSRSNSRHSDCRKFIVHREIAHVHFQDILDTPRELIDNNNRVIPGDGEAPIVAILKKLAQKQYSGALSVELFLMELRQGDPYEIASRIKQKCAAVMRQANVL